MATRSGRRIAAVLLLACLAVAASRNLIDYDQVLRQKRQAARELAVLPGGCGDGDAKACNRALRHSLYALLESLRTDPAYHQGHRTGVVVIDPDFYAGVYIDKAIDAALQSCAIQPFSVPAMTGMPLLGGLLARASGCRFDSYGYQYLPNHESPHKNELEDPCSLARDRGFGQVAIIRRQGERFVAEGRDCVPG